MASNFFALFDDIAVLMDDVVVMSKMATKKTAGILVDDLAVNADKASGFVSSREIPVLWKITKGSFLNKVIILPVAFLLSAFLPVVITPILLVGGIYLGFEGAEKVYHFLFHRNDKSHKKINEMEDTEADEYEKQKIKSAILVDFILSVEIIILTLSTVQDEPLNIQIPVVTIISLLATIGVYGLVALIVRMDDFGFKLIANSRRPNSLKERIGLLMVNILPYIVRFLSIFGTLAMILVAGGIFVHNVHFIHDIVHAIPTLIGEFLTGLVVGFIALALFKLFKKLFGKNGKEKGIAH